MSAEGREYDTLRERVADMLAYNDECGPGPVSRQEYLEDAAEIIAAVRAASRLPNDHEVLRLICEPGTGDPQDARERQIAGIAHDIGWAGALEARS